MEPLDAGSRRARLMRFESNINGRRGRETIVHADNERLLLVVEALLKKQ